MLFSFLDYQKRKRNHAQWKQRMPCQGKWSTRLFGQECSVSASLYHKEPTVRLLWCCSQLTMPIPLAQYRWVGSLTIRWWPQLIVSNTCIIKQVSASSWLQRSSIDIWAFSEEHKTLRICSTPPPEISWWNCFNTYEIKTICAYALKRFRSSEEDTTRKITSRVGREHRQSAQYFVKFAVWEMWLKQEMVNTVGSQRIIKITASILTSYMKPWK